MNPQNAGRNRDKQPSTWYEWRKAMWEYAPVRGGEFLVLLAITDHVDKNGYCYVSRARLARMSRLTEGHVTRMVASLEARGLLVVKRGLGRRIVSRYWLIAPGPGGVDEVQPGITKGSARAAFSDPKGHKSALKGHIGGSEKVAPMPPRTYIEPLKNPDTSKSFEIGDRGDFENIYKNLPANMAREMRAKIALRTEKEQQAESRAEDGQGSGSRDLSNSLQNPSKQPSQG